LIFFAISSAVANITKTEKLSKTISTTLLVFLLTSLIAAIFMVVGVNLFPIHQILNTNIIAPEKIQEPNFGQQITALFTTSDFFELLSRKNMMALIIFSLLIGFATLRAKDDGEVFRKFLTSGNDVFKSLITMIMKLAPIGLGAYFAYLVGVFGKELFSSYAYSLGLYYSFGFIYYLLAFSVYAFFAGGFKTVKIYWKNNILPSLTALGTCSSIATIPANLTAAEKMGMSKDIGNMVVPLGATLHKEGSSIGAIVKIGVVFSLFGRDFTGIDTICLALGIAVLTSIVEGGIPNGGYMGELFIITAYGFPVEALSVVMIIATLIDPMATLLNATGDTASGMLIARLTEGKNWIKNQLSTSNA
jgi:Na+/H+-dicarboxylate symporter